MKPDWNCAPSWAQWLAHDEYGLWWWFEEKPMPMYFKNGVKGWQLSHPLSNMEYAGGEYNKEGNELLELERRK